MKKDEVIKKLQTLMTMDALRKSVEKLMTEKPNNDGLNLLKATLNAKDDPQHLWFTALAILCTHKRNLSGTLLETAMTIAGQPPLPGLNKAELIDAIASGSKLTKADAGRLAKLTKADAGRDLDGTIEVTVTVKK